MADILSLIPSITKTLILTTALAVPVALATSDDEATAGQPTEAEAPGFSPDATSAGSKLEQIISGADANDDDSFTTMVFSAIPNRPREFKPPSRPKPKAISTIQTTKAGEAHLAIGKALDFLTQLRNPGDQVDRLRKYLKEADAALDTVKLGTTFQEVVGKIQNEANHLMQFTAEVGEPGFLEKHVSTGVDFSLLKSAFDAWNIFINALRSGI